MFGRWRNRRRRGGPADALTALGETRVSRKELERRLADNGLGPNDPRVAHILDTLDGVGPSDAVELEAFVGKLDGRARRMLIRAFAGDLVAADFQSLKRRLSDIAADAKRVSGGNVATYIPELARAEPTTFSGAVCTIDGQQAQFGEAGARFTIQSTHKPLAYALAVSEHGVDTVHRHVGKEPSGREFNSIELNSAGLPHNPMVNAGGIMSASMIATGRPMEERVETVRTFIQDLAGGQDIGFDGAVYASEQAHADRNFAIGYLMREQRAFPDGADMQAALDLYFRACSFTADVGALAAIAATLANDGVCPLTGEAVLPHGVAQAVISIMFTCGMYDLSGEFAFQVGVPAKSGVSGALLLVAPGFGGFAAFSPPIDEVGHSVRGLHFARHLVQALDLHTFDADPRDDPDAQAVFKARPAGFDTFQLLSASRVGDLAAVRRHIARGVNVDASDYDGRTALHVAAEAGHEDVVRFLLSAGALRHPQDARGETPADAAARKNRQNLAALLKPVGL